MEWRSEAVSLAWAWGPRSLAVAYWSGEEGPRSFYEHPPSWEALPQAQRRRRESWQAPPEAVASALEESLLPWEPHEAVRRSLELLASGRAWVVAAGQQPGFLGGPLYTFFKALSVARWAQVLHSRTGQPFVPLFWVASEDDDFAEVSTAWLRGQDQRLHPLRFRPEPERAVSVGPLKADWASVETELRQVLPPSEFREAFLAELAEAFQDRSLAEGFGRLLLRWLGSQGLLVADPMWPQVRSLLTPFLEAVLRAPLHPTRLVNEAGRALSEQGFSPQVHKQEHLCPFYLYSPSGERQRLLCQGEVLRSDQGTWSREELSALLRASPERFSLSLILRPVAQDYLFPTVAFLGGPGEIAYFAQLREVYRWLGVAMPLILPRFTATLVEPRMGRVLERYGLRPQEVRGDVEALLNRLIGERYGEEAQERFGEARQAAAQALSPLLAWVKEVDPNLEKPAQQTLLHLEFELEKLLQKTMRALKRRNEVLAEQIRSVAEGLYPQRQLQERVMNPYAFWVRYGPALREALLHWPIEEALGCHLFLSWS